MRKLLKKMKRSQKGAVSVLVVFTLLMFVIILMRMYVLVTVSAKSQLKSDARIQEIIR